MRNPADLQRVYQQLNQVHREIARLASLAEALRLPKGRRLIAEAQERGQEFARTLRRASSRTWKREVGATLALYQVVDDGAEELQDQLQKTLYGLIYGLDAALDELYADREAKSRVM